MAVMVVVETDDDVVEDDTLRFVNPLAYRNATPGGIDADVVEVEEVVWGNCTTCC